MNSADLIRTIEQDPRRLIGGMIGELRSNLGTSHYRRLSDEELFQRGYAVYHHLTEWLAFQDEAPVQTAGEDLGRRRFAEGIPLGQVILALILEEKRIWEFLGASLGPPDQDLRRAVQEFFQKTIYFTGHGYETALAESNRRARRAEVPATPAPKPPSRAEPGDEEQGPEISRGGQIGEFGG